ncbi:MAG: PadR family transcriptional regulator [Clostridiales bacterium]|nr:PadR family transcriptional regulator [Clostridiales bacterium]
MTFQISTSLLDACVLALLSREDAYGYILTQNVKEIINVSESTLYPVLRRLQNENYLTVYDAPFGGRNRRYYRITDTGKDRLAEYLYEWDNYKNKVDKILLHGTLLLGGNNVE